MWDRFRNHGLFDGNDEEQWDEDDLAGQLWGRDVRAEDEEDMFQLPLPDEI